MGKELLRNGGFESGDSRFWAFLAGSTINIQTTEKKRGSYAAEIVGAVEDQFWLYNSDYIPVTMGEVYKLLGWMKGGKVDWLQTYHIYFYDSVFTNIGYIASDGWTSPAEWTKKEMYINIPERASYMQFLFMGYASAAEKAYLDSFSLQKIAVENVGVLTEELINIRNETTKHTVTGSEFFTGMWKEAEYYFNLTSFTESGETNPVTIDVKIETYDPATNTWRDVMVFQQKSCGASGNVTTHEAKTLIGNLGWKQRVSYTTAGAGTIGDCDFKVGVVYKR